VVLCSNLIERSKINYETPTHAVCFADKHRARAERAAARSDKLRLHSLVDELLVSLTMLSVFRPNTNVGRSGGAGAMRRAKRRGIDGVGNSMSVARRTPKDGAMALEQVSDLREFGRVREDLGTEVNLLEYLVDGVFWARNGRFLPMLELS